MSWVWMKIRALFKSGNLLNNIRERSGSDSNNSFTCDDPCQLNGSSTSDDEYESPELRSVCWACQVALEERRESNSSRASSMNPTNNENHHHNATSVNLPFLPIQSSLSNIFFDDDIDIFANRQQRSSSDPILALPSIDQFPRLRTTRSNDNNLFRTLENLSNLLLNPVIKSSFLQNTVSKQSIPNSSLPLNDLEQNKGISCYPIRRKTRQAFLNDLRRAQETDNFSALQNFYLTTFNSFAEICALFKTHKTSNDIDLDDPGINMEFLYIVYDTLEQLPQYFHKNILKSIINCLLEDPKILRANDEIRATFVLLLCPVYSSQFSYVVFAHLLRYCILLPSAKHRILVSWFKTLEVARFRSLIRWLLQFISISQFQSRDRRCNKLAKTKWWIPTATKLLALINVANNECKPALVSYTELYNSSLDYIDLMEDYYIWQNGKQANQFAYCQYPFILSIFAKRTILTKDSEQQMISNARRSLVAKMTRHQSLQIDIFFLNIHVRRSHLVTDSLHEIAYKRKELKKKLKVSFVGEPGLDMGGLTKEWFLLLIREIFHSDYGMFVYHGTSKCHWFSMSNEEKHLREYNLIGVLMGLAVYNSNILDLRFPSICYRKLLTPPVVPTSDDNTIGVIDSITIEDLAEILPEVAKGLKNLITYEGNVEELLLNFQISFEEFNEIKTYSLVTNGEQIPVKNENREEYVQLYLNWILNIAIYQQFKAFYLGFHSVCASNALIMLRGEEVEMLVCGVPSLDFSELRKVTEYDGFDSHEEFIQEFWEVIESFSEELKRKFLFFTTGSDRAPIGGMSEMIFKITRLPLKIDNLPEAHTCFNQLVIPRYENSGILRNKLVTAISNAVGFGFE